MGTHRKIIPVCACNTISKTQCNVITIMVTAINPSSPKYRVQHQLGKAHTSFMIEYVLWSRRNMTHERDGSLSRTLLYEIII